MTECIAAVPGGVIAQRRLITVGLRRWKAANLAPFFELEPAKVNNATDVDAVSALQPNPNDGLVIWGAKVSPELEALASTTGAQLVRMEDGFVRSVGLGSDLIPPMSLVFDRRGIYFDPTRVSDLEFILQNARFSEQELAEARRVREYITAHGITKYNLEPRAKAAWNTQGKRVIVVPGQVEDDASIRLGCTDIRTNEALLQAARASRPDAFIVYKPHPDVASGNRAGKLALFRALEHADHVETRLSVVSCIDACDEIHTMTSLTGFDALLREKPVVTYGQPFYAGWGLTEDRARDATGLTRRQRRLHLDELVAGALLRYPVYWDWELKGYTTCEAVLRQIVTLRTALEANGGLEKLRSGYLRRQWRKLRILSRAWLSGK